MMALSRKPYQTRPQPFASATALEQFAATLASLGTQSLKYETVLRSLHQRRRIGSGYRLPKTIHQVGIGVYTELCETDIG